METKRKIEESFALLNSLWTSQNNTQDASSSTPATASAAPSDKLAAKRKSYLPPRPAVLDKLSKLSSSRPTSKDSIAVSIASLSSTNPPNATLAPTHKRLKSASSDRKRYLPWSREQFHERLQTFRPSTWFDKPRMVNAVECAKLGWINKGDDRLECYGSCGGVVIVRIDQDHAKTFHQGHTGSEEADDALSAPREQDQDMDDAVPEIDIEAIGPKFHAMLNDNHAANCPWKSHPCDDSIYKFPVVSLSQAQQDFTARAVVLQKMATDPLVERISHPLTVDQVSAVASIFPLITDTKILLLSLFGWTCPKNQRVLSCEACHTHCTYISSTSMDDDVEDGEEETGFDVVQSHKWYCYWVDAENVSTKKEGWRILLEMLLAGSGSNRTNSGETQPGQPAQRIQPSDAVAQVKRMLRGQAPLPTRV